MKEIERMGQEGGDHFVTLKSDRNLIREEHEIAIEAEQFAGNDVSCSGSKVSMSA